jgi:hypothetical protein
MASIDNASDYVKIKDRINSIKTYNDLKIQYSQVKKRSGDSIEKSNSEVNRGLDEFKKNGVKNVKTEVKNQFEQLLEMLKISSSDYNNKSSNLNTVSYLKSKLTLALKNIEPKVSQILNNEIIKAIGCDQQQTYTQGQIIYIKVKSIDLANLLKLDPESRAGKLLYEKNPIVIQDFPFSMNRQLYQRIQSPSNSYNDQYGQNYKGASGQDLFNIKFFENHPVTGVGGGWFGITLSNRDVSAVSVVEFINDYYKSIKLFDLHNVFAYIIDAMSGAISMNVNYSVSFLKDANFFEKMLLRILGLCFDNRQEIDVSGISKLGETGTIDDTFFQLNSIELREIDQRVTNIKNGVIQFLQCDNVSIPINPDAVLDALNNITLIDNNVAINKPEEVTNALLNNSNIEGLGIDAQLQFAVDWNFINSLTKGLIFSLFSPKVLLPIYTMFTALGKTGLELINSYEIFIKFFKSFVVNVVSKVNALLVEELFELLKKDIKNLIQQIILDVAKERANKKLVMILKLTNLLIAAAQLIDDWRKCKSVINEILRLLRAASTFISSNGSSLKIPLPLLFAAELLDGFSESRAFLGVIEELEKIGVPTGPMPDGSPNLEVLSRFAQIKAVASEDAENNKIQVAIGSLAITPAGVTIPASAFGKKF